MGRRREFMTSNDARHFWVRDFCTGFGNMTSEVRFDSGFWSGNFAIVSGDGNIWVRIIAKLFCDMKMYTEVKRNKKCYLSLFHQREMADHRLKALTEF